MHTRRSVFLLLLSLICVTAPFAIFAQTTKSAKPKSSVVPPKWYTNIPKDSANIVTRGKGEAKDQQLAIDRAAIVAREEIVAVVEKGWKELLQAIKKEGIAAGEPQVESITLKGSKITKQKAVKSKKVWTAFVLVSFPKSSVPPLLLDRVRQNEQWYSQVKDSKSVRELESVVH